MALLVTATMWGIFWIPLRWLETQGLNGIMSTFLIYAGTLVVLLPILILHRAELRLQPGILLGIFLSSGWTNTAFIISIVEGEIMRVILLFYLSPVWSTLLAHFILKEHLSQRAYLTLTFAVVGAILILWDPTLGAPWPSSQADWLALSSGIAFSFTNFFTHMANRVSVSTKVSVTWAGVIFVAGAVIMLSDRQFILPDSKTISLAMLIGISMLSIMTFCVVYGVSKLPVHRSAIILLFEVVAAAISSYLLTDERMDIFEWSGGAVVMLAAYLAATKLPHEA
jgi:drug/metabolite transporter (DMT)-like permease